MYQYAAFPVPGAVDFDDPRVASYQTRWDAPVGDGMEALWYWPALDTPDLPATTRHLDSLRTPVPENQTMVSVFSGHDAHLAVARAGQVLGVVELERRERRRYFHPGFVDDADGAWARALRDARRLAGVDVFDVGVYVAVPTAVFPSALASIARDWYAADHHASHASLCFRVSHLT